MAKRGSGPRSQRLLAIIFTALAFGLAGCGDNSDGSQLSVAPGALTLAKGRMSMATASVNGRAVGSAVRWRAINPQVATVVEGDGGTAVITAVGTGETRVVATLEDRTAELTVTVGEAEIDAIAITPAMPQVAAGTSADLTVTATLSDRTTRNVTSQVQWRSSDTAKATVDAAGRLRGVVKGAATVTATLGALTATTSATITDAVLTAIAVTPVNLSLAKGLTRQMTATGTFSDASTQDLTATVTWASSATGNATVSAAGVVTGAGVGNAMISATMGAISGQVAVDITAAVLQSIAITPVDPTLAKGLTLSLTATGTFSDATTSDISAAATWTSSDVAVATTDGRVVTGVTPGDATISAAMDGITGTTALEVTPAVLVTIQVTPAATQLAKGRTRQMTATGLLSDGTNQNLTQTALWASSDAARVSISNADGSRGLATAQNLGTATLSATMGGVTGSTTLEVTAAELISIAIEPASFSLALGRTQQLTATGTFSDATTDDITEQASWSSSDNAVASVSSTAGTRGLVSAVAAGDAEITAALAGVTATSQATITGATLVSIAVTPATGSLPVGRTRQYTATGTFSDATTDDITTQVTWSSSDAAVVEISNADGSHGLATARTPGDVTITAALAGVTGTATLSAVPLVLLSIAVTPDPATLPVGAGAALQLTATGTFDDGSTLELTTAVTWSSSDEALATVSNADGSRGVATGVATGDVTISATMGAISGSAAVTVVAPVITSIAVAPANVTLDVGGTQQLTATATLSDGGTRDVTATATWASTDGAVASVSAAGLVTALAGGTVTISAAQGGVSGTASVFVKALVSIAITPAGDLAHGTSRQLVATGTFNDATTVDVTQLATWTSSDAAALTIGNAVGSKGLATAVSTAGATITATVGGVSGSLAIAGCKILVNEVQLAGATSGTGQNEWVEIASACTADQNLAGLRLVYRSAAGTGDVALVTLTGTIAAGEYKFYVHTGVAALYPTASGTFPGGATGVMSGNAGGVAIRIGAAGAIVDSLGYGTGVTNGFVEGTAATTPPGGSSASRIPDRTDTNSNSVDFAVRATPTPGAANQ